MYSLNGSQYLKRSVSDSPQEDILSKFGGKQGGFYVSTQLGSKINQNRKVKVKALRVGF